MQEKLALHCGKVYVPTEKLQQKIIYYHHDMLIAGHGGQWKTIEKVTRNYWWGGVTRDVKCYVEGCDKCQRYKNFPVKKLGKLIPLEIPTRPWEIISTDFIVKLPECQGKDAVLTICDHFTKQVHLIPTNEATSAEGLARLFRDHVWKLHGLPKAIVSDRGPQFAATIMKDLNNLLGIKTRMSTAYHPSTNGQTERDNQQVEQYLRLFINYRQDDWVDWISIAEFCYNDTIHTSTKQMPFYTNHGYHP